MFKNKEPNATGVQRKQLAIIEIATQPPMRAQIEYETLEDLARSVSELLMDVENFDYYGKASVILPSKKSYRWLPSHALGCFALGKISVTGFVNKMFGKEVRL